MRKTLDVFVIMPIRHITPRERMEILSYIETLKKEGKSVYCPLSDTDQTDQIGIRICRDNLMAMERAKEVHIWWNPESQGILFDFGMAFALRKKIRVINFLALKGTPGKSFTNVLLWEAWALGGIRDEPHREAPQGNGQE